LGTGDRFEFFGFPELWGADNPGSVAMWPGICGFRWAIRTIAIRSIVASGATGCHAFNTILPTMSFDHAAGGTLMRMLIKEEVLWLRDSNRKPSINPGGGIIQEE